MCKEYIIYEFELPWWFFWLHPSDNGIFAHYDEVCYGGIPPKSIGNILKTDIQN